jgi:hypothetical protein
MRVKFAVEMYSAIFDQQLSGGYRLYEYVAKINICSQLEHTIARAFGKRISRKAASWEKAGRYLFVAHLTERFKLFVLD